MLLFWPRFPDSLFILAVVLIQISFSHFPLIVSESNFGHTKLSGAIGSQEDVLSSCPTYITMIQFTSYGGRRNGVEETPINLQLYLSYLFEKFLFYFSLRP